MKRYVNGEEPFKCVKSTFAIGPTSNGYTLSFAVNKDSDVWTDWDEAVEADTNVVVNDATPFMYFKLTGNKDNAVEVIL